MKPVAKGPSPGPFTAYQQAMPYLLGRLGCHCSYCEVEAPPQALAVEHIYPKHPHPVRELDWDNFLVSCSTCNTYKRLHLGDGRQRALLNRYLWPHLDNTFKAFEYSADGRVEVRSGLTPQAEKAAKATRDMVGLMRSPAKAEGFADQGVAYDGAAKRSQQWAQAVDFRGKYLASPTPALASLIAAAAAKMGHFSIWMEVFKDRPEVRAELIQAFKVDAACFDANTNPVTKGRV